jgi:hypothetical protein
MLDDGSMNNGLTSLTVDVVVVDDGVDGALTSSAVIIELLALSDVMRPLEPTSDDVIIASIIDI